MPRRNLGWVMFGLLLAGAGAGRAAGLGQSLAPARISREAPGPPRAAPGNPAPPSLIRSVELSRPEPIELTVLASPPREQLALEEPLPECDAAPRALLRAGCPEAPPDVQPCAAEGRECRYAALDGCVAQYECVYGLWSPIGSVCPEVDPGQPLLGSGSCEQRTPIADAPCADEGLSCGHLPCGIGAFTQLVAECRCGRWYQRWPGCPETR